jgi:hypothetical protein
MTTEPPEFPAAPMGTVQYVIEPLYRARGWIKFLAILSFVAGAFYIFTIVGILFAWMPIAVGVFLIQAISAIEQAHRSGTAEDARRGIAKLRSLFVFYGVLAALGIAFVLVALAFGVLGGLVESARELR